MDNLFMSPKCAKIVKHDTGKDIRMHGVRRSSQSILSCILQTIVTQKGVTKNRGTVMVSVLVGDYKCKGLVALSFYDSKPVYFISNEYEKVE